MFNMHRTLVLLALTLLALFIASCSREVSPPGGESPAGISTDAKQLESELEAEVGRRIRRAEIREYLMLPVSFIGGSFPRETAVLLREVQQLVSKYVTHLEASGTPHQGVLEAHRALEKYAEQAAELYELMAAQPSNTVRDTREGLETTDPAVMEEFNRRVDVVNAAHDHFDRAIKALPPEQQASFSRMGLTARIK